MNNKNIMSKRFDLNWSTSFSYTTFIIYYFNILIYFKYKKLNFFSSLREQNLKFSLSFLSSKLECLCLSLSATFTLV